MQLVDTHCHIHEAAEHFTAQSETRDRWQRSRKVGSSDEIIKAAIEADVTRMICVGTTLADSELAVEFVQSRPNTWASIGIHPHEAQNYVQNLAHRVVADSGAPSPYQKYGSVRASSAPSATSKSERSKSLERFAAVANKPKVVAVGECGLDYFYDHSPRAAQEKVLRFQIELALERDLPMIFHVRDAFEDFWPIFDEYKSIRGVIHSFSATERELAEVLRRNLYVGLNGIMTFTKDSKQLAAAKAVPQDRLLLETDAPFLTPVPYRGTICEPKHVRTTAGFLADLRGETLDKLAEVTTQNARHLFGL